MMVTERTWIEAQRETWRRPREWGVAQLAVLGGLVLLLALAAFTVTRPGEMSGGPAPFEASLLFADHTQGRYVYELASLPDGGTERVKVTLRRLNEQRRAESVSQTVTIVLLRRSTPVGSYVAGTGALDDAGVIGWARIGPDRREGAARRTPNAPQERVDL
ncbi:MAG TPA: hypothetical protein VFX49_21090 [Chloroflexota bacterium]|nr:hypothetical protein [Chloroflexota bacterium]